jgi:hypothetical protein
MHLTSVPTCGPYGIAAYWVVTQCGLVERYVRFGGTFCLHFQGWSLELLAMVNVALCLEKVENPWFPTAKVLKTLNRDRWDKKITLTCFSLIVLGTIFWQKRTLKCYLRTLRPKCSCSVPCVWDMTKIVTRTIGRSVTDSFGTLSKRYGRLSCQPSSYRPKVNHCT